MQSRPITFPPGDDESRSESLVAAVWIPSHCGIQLNEEGDKLANNGLRSFSLVDHQDVPLSLQQATSIHRNRPKGDLIFLEDVPTNLTISLRRAELLLHQIMGDCFVYSGAFHGPKDYTREPLCKKCRGGMKETVEHLLVQWTGRQLLQRKFLGRMSRETPYQLCKKKSLDVPQSLNTEGLIEGPRPR